MGDRYQASVGENESSLSLRQDREGGPERKNADTNGEHNDSTDKQDSYEEENREFLLSEPESLLLDLEDNSEQNCRGLVGAIESIRDGIFHLLTPTNPELLPAHHSPLFPRFVKRKRRLPYPVRMLAITIYLTICVGILLILFFFNTYAATTEYGRPARLDCWDPVDMVNHTKFTIWGEPKWVPVRCPAYCQYRGDRNATIIGNATTSSIFTRDSSVCEAALQKGYVTTLFGGCAAVRVRPLEGPKNKITQLDGTPSGSLQLTAGVEHVTDTSVQKTKRHASFGRQKRSDQGKTVVTNKKTTTTTTSTVTTQTETSVSVDNDVLNGSDNPSPKFPSNYVMELGQCRSSHCYELAFTVLGVALLIVILLLVFSPPRGTFYSTLMIVGYWYVVFVVYPTYNEKGRDRMDDALGTFSTFLVFTYALYWFAVKRNLYDTSWGVYIPDTILLFVCPFFFMLHMTYVKPFLDFSLSKGGLAGLSYVQIFFAVSLVITMVSLTLFQFIHVYRHGLLAYYLAAYGVVVMVLLTITLLTMYANGLTFHLHHYQLSLLLFPLVRFQTRFCVFCTGILLGMFVNGVACYGFDSTWVLFDPQHPQH